MKKVSKKDNENAMNYNKSGLVILLGSVFFSFVWFAGIIVFSTPEPLAELEEDSSAAVTEAVSAVAAKKTDFSKVKEPWVSSPALLLKGEKVYQINCASCHGNKGVGDGIVAASLIPKPRNLREGQWKQGGSSIQLYTTLISGVEGSSMVSFSYLSQLDRWALVHYIRSITKNKVEDDFEKLKEFAKTAK